MTTVGLKVEGAKQLRAALKAAGEDLTDLKDVNAEVAALVAQAAAARAPHRTGRLASTVRGNRAAGRATVQAGRAAVPYAGPIHWGWPRRRIAAQPWVAQTAQDLEPRWVEIFTNGVQTLLDRITGA